MDFILAHPWSSSSVAIASLAVLLLSTLAMGAFWSKNHMPVDGKVRHTKLAAIISIRSIRSIRFFGLYI